MAVKKVKDGEKPYYGLYFSYPVIIGFGSIGVIGIILMILGFFVGYYFNILLWILGILLIVFFLWTAIGFISGNLITFRQKDFDLGFLEGFQNARILDCGCGPGRHAVPLAREMPKGFFLIGIDIFVPRPGSKSPLQLVQKNARLVGVENKTKFLFGSITDIPFDDEEFDIVTAMGVIHELSKEVDQNKAFSEIRRVIKPHGIFYLRELNRFALLLRYGTFGFYFKPSTYWEKKLKNAKFKLIKKYNEGIFTVFLVIKD